MGSFVVVIDRTHRGGNIISYTLYIFMSREGGFETKEAAPRNKLNQHEGGDSFAKYLEIERRNARGRGEKYVRRAEVKALAFQNLHTDLWNEWGNTHANEISGGMLNEAQVLERTAFFDSVPPERLVAMLEERQRIVFDGQKYERLDDELKAGIDGLDDAIAEVDTW